MYGKLGMKDYKLVFRKYEFHKVNKVFCCPELTAAVVLRRGAPTKPILITNATV